MRILFAAALFLMSSPVFAFCNGNLEAQFIAQVAHVDYVYEQTHSQIETTYTLKNFRFYQENATCPLDQSLAEQASIFVEAYLKLDEGQEVSGVLVYNPISISFEVE